MKTHLKERASTEAGLAHAPGPWRVYETRIGPRTFWEIRDANDEEIGRAWTPGDALALAATPDLLAALKVALPEIDAGENVTRRSGILDGARAAIAKAEGTDQ